MYGIFVHETKQYPFAWWIATGFKSLETRNKDMLRELVGQRVAIISTKAGRKPLIIGTVEISGKFHATQEEFKKLVFEHLVTRGSRYECGANGKYCYVLRRPYHYKQYKPLPETAIYHGRSYCEF